VGIADSLINPNGSTIFLDTVSNGVSKCAGCAKDAELCRDFFDKRRVLVQKLGAYSHKIENRGTPYIRADEASAAAYKPGVLSAADDYDDALEAVDQSRSGCSGAEEFTNEEGQKMVYCPRYDEEFPH
jgi:hypothetical protein